MLTLIFKWTHLSGTCQGPDIFEDGNIDTYCVSVLWFHSYGCSNTSSVRGPLYLAMLSWRNPICTTNRLKLVHQNFRDCYYVITSNVDCVWIDGVSPDHDHHIHCIAHVPRLSFSLGLLLLMSDTNVMGYRSMRGKNVLGFGPVPMTIWCEFEKDPLKTLGCTAHTRKTKLAP